ncbi:peptide-N4-(N-acetyl-beta-glucosaminyl)asparagine amidase A [Plectosphaerella plurivora]|uniref:Peptide-N4-(N-acetyl-beta-glucosaminyl)asparagine amidase A n=1 Tax=Plectosphaerella plurivora TaxID=936078 RepID=A0A9P8V2P5_9PEZI|nr:peptide-N4-(N-acetyl-beta-glucosaminyl)asparagine amidase A [Plectosphaerella plurivora]
MRFLSVRGIVVLALAGGAFAALDLAIPRPQDQIYLGGHEDAAPALHKNHSSPAPLECFQVAQPVLGPHGRPIQADDGALHRPPCSITLMEHSFGFSYGKPYVGNYTPPGCDFDRVVLNLTVTSAGRQFDRLAIMFLNDTEIWRTSTAEPKPDPGIRWTYVKDVTPYLSVWQAPQTLIFDLGNLVDDKYTGAFNCTLTATFFTAGKVSEAEPADLVIPISARKGASGQSSAWTVPQQKATDTIAFPQNANRAVFSISANGQLAEEFWWSNVLQSDVGAFNETVGQLPGLSPFREVQLYIDGQLAGVQWPFPVVFTGGVSPSLHRPIVGLDAFDLREYEIDISPWLPLLCDGQDHTFDIRIAGIYDNAKLSELTDRIGHYWVVTGKIFVWLGETGSVTRGRVPVVEPSNPIILISSQKTQNASGVNEALEYSLHVQRTISIQGELLNNGSKQKTTWKQDLAYSNLGNVDLFGTRQVNMMNITGSDRARGALRYDAAYSYPLYANQTYSVGPSNEISIDAQLNQTLVLEILGAATFPTGIEVAQRLGDDPGPRFQGSRLSTWRDGRAAFRQSGDRKHSSGFGSTKQRFTFDGLRLSLASGGPPITEELYTRHVSAINDTVVSDHERGLGGMTLRSWQGPATEAEGEGEGEDHGHFAPVERQFGNVQVPPDSGGILRDMTELYGG